MSWSYARCKNVEYTAKTGIMPPRADGAERDGVFLRNADIKETAAVFFAEIRQTGTGFHRRRNGAQLLI